MYKLKIIADNESYREYFDRINKHNQISYAQIDLVGFTEAPNKKGEIVLMPVIKQEFIKGSPATFEQIDKYFHDRDFKGDSGYYTGKIDGEKVIVSDAGSNNAIYANEHENQLNLFNS